MSEGLPLFRNSKVILRAYKQDDGSIRLVKVGPLARHHLMHMTQAPGWDAAYVDQIFTAGVTGTLIWAYEGWEYEISIEGFREHAFKKDIAPYGPQYHVHRRYYTPRVNPQREGTQRPQPVIKPRSFAFGEWVPCRVCHGVPNKAKDCLVCKGLGIEKWPSSNPTT